MIIDIVNKHKKLFIIIVVLILLFLITIAVINYNKQEKMRRFFEQETERVRKYDSITDFQTIEEVALYTGCKYIKQEQSKVENINTDIYMELPEKLDYSKDYQKEFILNLIQYSAYVMKYKSFVIIDQKNDINIVVYCNEEKQLVEKYLINGTESYYEKQKNDENIKSFETVNPIELEVTSEDLNNIISSNWVIREGMLGTVESSYRGYDIYFDEGIQVRKINGKAFNIVFTDKYTKSIVNNLSVNSTEQEIEKTLGKPHFKSGNLIGYKGNKLYVFFYDKQVSIYRIDESSKEEFANIVEKNVDNQDIKTVISEIKNLWKDYDIYEYSENSVKLQYTLKGVCIKYDSTAQRGIVFYNNYKGNAYGNTTLEQIVKGEKQVLDNMFIENKDLVFETEINRVNTLDDTSKNNNNSSSVVLNTSNEFKTYKKVVNRNEGTYEISFIAIDNKYPNSELKENINKGVWYDDYSFVYSVKQKGIYVYNVQTCTYKTIITGKDNYDIKSIEGKQLNYDETSIELDL